MNEKTTLFRDTIEELNFYKEAVSALPVVCCHKKKNFF